MCYHHREQETGLLSILSAWADKCVLEVGHGSTTNQIGDGQQLVYPNTSIPQREKV